jgi:hypothetical protein
VTVSVLSNEFDGPGIDYPMAVLLERRDIIGKVRRADLFLVPDTCNDNESDNLICTTEEEPDDPDQSIATRFYDIEVTAQDAAGNTGVTTCTVNVVPPKHYCGKGGKGRGKGRRYQVVADVVVVADAVVSPGSTARPIAKLQDCITDWFNPVVTSNKTGDVAPDNVTEASVADNNVTTVVAGATAVTDNGDTVVEGIVISADNIPHKDRDCQHDFNDLRLLRRRSMQRIVVSQLALEWDPELDDTLVIPPLPPPPLAQGKGKGGKGGRQRCPLDCPKKSETMARRRRTR